MSGSLPRQMCLADPDSRPLFLEPGINGGIESQAARLIIPPRYTQDRGPFCYPFPHLYQPVLDLDMSQPVESTRDPGLKPKPRKLIVCIDGTSNQFSEKNTNVVELYSRITKDSTQLTYYNSGVGTYARPFWWSFAYLKQQLAGIIDLMIAWNFDQVIIGAYRWLSDHYQPGDQIFLFGFSRGAYQVRTLAGMIHTVGLIYPGNQEQIPFAWAIYSGDERDSVKNKFKEAFCPEHSQEYVWFAGTHSDIGGGNKANPTLDRGGEPLKWMMEEAHKKGLSVQLHDVKIGIPHAEVTESMGVSSLMGFFYMILEYAPFLCWKEHLSNGETRSRWWFHNKRAREVLPYQSIHWTVKASLNQGENKPNTANKTYSPKAVLLDGQLTEEEKKKGIQKTIEWGKLPMGYQTERKPACMDDYQFTRMVDILKDECRHADEVWFERLQKHVLVDNPGKPDAIWAYGGPQFLDRLFKTYPDQQDTAKIARAIVGFGKGANPSKPTTWACIKGWLGLSSKDVDEPNSVDAQWNWDRIPKEARSMALAREVTNILSDVTETRTFTQIIHDASETIAYGIAAMFDQLTGGFGARIESAAPWEKEKTVLAEGALNVISSLFQLGNYAPREAFRCEGITVYIRPLICAKDKHPELSLQAMRTTALLMQDLYCGQSVADTEIIPDLVRIMRDYMAEDDSVKQQLANEASITLATVTKDYMCCRKLGNDSESMEKLFQVLKKGKYVKNVLQIVKNVSVHFSDLVDEHEDGSFTLVDPASQ
ncbi:alternative mRNA splicing, via spliceosome [Rhizoctonia solani]|uniref:Alternative mRNA splicing, via spliceosome n=1 Tax=Rhizoctonia solani TaxID=456999 RepID=A0A8H7M000_9AGAM|nr:alternative mRNA splicing, via spliceosome [Rhizoctonia solani]